METKETLLQKLNQTILSLLNVYKNMATPDMMVDESWSAQDILCHITFWHESFARNVRDIVNDVKPTPLKGKFVDLNQRGVDEMSAYPLEVIISKLEAAHQIIQHNILNPKITLIPYKIGSRSYTPEEHLDIVNEHISGHLRRLAEVAHLITHDD